MTRFSENGIFLLTGLICVVFVLSGFDPPVFYQILLLGGAVSLIGLPHGAVDSYIAYQAALWRSPGGLALFMMLYLILAASVLAIWFAFPVLALSLFLVLSAWHFGADMGSDQPLMRWLSGVFLLGLPAFFHVSEVSAIFMALSGEKAAHLVSGLKSLVLVPGACLAFCLIWRPAIFHSPEQAGLTGLAVLLFAWLLSPLFFFAVYFCSLHSLRHFRRVTAAMAVEQRKQALIHAIMLTGLTLLLAVLLFQVFQMQFSVQESLLRVIFIGLAALTVPHMILVDLVCRFKPGVLS